MKVKIYRRALKALLKKAEVDIPQLEQWIRQNKARDLYAPCLAGGNNLGKVRFLLSNDVAKYESNKIFLYNGPLATIDTITHNDFLMLWLRIKCSQKDIEDFCKELRRIKKDWNKQKEKRK